MSGVTTVSAHCRFTCPFPPDVITGWKAYWGDCPRANLNLLSNFRQNREARRRLLLPDRSLPGSFQQELVESYPGFQTP